MSINSLNFKLFFFIFLFSVILAKNGISKENYIIASVNKLPITKLDVVNRSRLIAFSIDNNFTQKNLENYYDQALRTLINEKVIFSAGTKINKDFDSLVSEKANQLLLSEFDNSRSKLNEFIKTISIPESTLIEKYKAQIIWGIVLKNKYKSKFAKIEKNIDKAIALNEEKKKEDLYDLAEIVINRVNNSKLLEKINIALKDGIGFLDIAKQVSISGSSKFKGKIGWKNFQDLPFFIKRRQNIIKEGEIYTAFESDKIRLIKILVKRVNGELSYIEDKVLIVQIKFPVNFQKKNNAYKKVRDKVNSLLFKQNNCQNLNKLKKLEKKGINSKIIETRIADLNPKIQSIIQKNNFFRASKPIFYGNSGYIYVKCSIKKAQIEKVNYKNLKKSTMNKYFIIYSEKLLKRLNNEANITLIEKLK